jgi:hypothetical protein
MSGTTRSAVNGPGSQQHQRDGQPDCEPEQKGPDVAQRSVRGPHPYHSCCRAPVVEGAQVKWPGVSVAGRGEPEASCSEWHGDGTAGENDRDSGWERRYQLGRWVKLVQADTSLVGKRRQARGSPSWWLAIFSDPQTWVPGRAAAVMADASP